MRLKIRSTLIVTFIFLIGGNICNAQPIHGHPQKISYANASEWPYDSAQCHWTPSDAVVVPPPANPTIGHTHVDMKFPRYSEFNIPLTIQFTLKLFHTSGKITEIFAGVYHGRNARDFVWDLTGSDVKPDLTGDILGLKQWSGHFTVDPDSNYPNGWINIFLAVNTRFDNGDTTQLTLREPVFSTVDTSKPEVWDWPRLLSDCIPGSPRRPDVQFGFNQVDIVDMLPLLPFSNPWPVRVNVIGYGTSSSIPDAIYEVRRDLDLHNGVHGITFQSQTFHGDLGVTTILDPTVLGSGTHKVAHFRTQSDGGLEEVSTLLVYDASVVGGGQTVTVPNVVGQQISVATANITSVGLTLGSQINVDNPVPVGQVVSQSPVAGMSVVVGTSINLTISNGPVVTPTWETFTPFFQRLVVPGQPTKYRICESQNVCKETM